MASDAKTHSVVRQQPKIHTICIRPLFYVYSLSLRHSANQLIYLARVPAEFSLFSNNKFEYTDTHTLCQLVHIRWPFDFTYYVYTCAVWCGMGPRENRNLRYTNSNRKKNTMEETKRTGNGNEPE